MSGLWHKAREAAEDARLLYRNERFDDACNRAYYAMFNAARALLLRQGISPDKAKRHATVLRLFSMHFVKDGPFDKEDGRAEAEQVRGQADYSSSETEIEAADDVMKALDRFMAKAEQVMKGAGDPAEERDDG